MFSLDKTFNAVVPLSFSVDAAEALFGIYFDLAVLTDDQRQTWMLEQEGKEFTCELWWRFESGS